MILNIQQDVFYLPKPNRIEVVASAELAPVELTRTAFMVPLMRDGSLVMANNCRRGLEIPGGHIDPGETMTAAAHRECWEETGHWVSHIKILGYLRMTSEGQVPPDWRYPHPLSYQQFFVGEVMHHVPYVDNDECSAPVVLTIQQALDTLKPSRLALYKEALKVMLGIVV
jgi:8-oxo-dGTP diphosphatase